MELNHVLCFLFSKFHKCDDQSIRAAIMDFFSSDDIHAAKELLMSIVSTFSGLNATPKIRERKGAARGVSPANSTIFS